MSRFKLAPSLVTIAGLLLAVNLAAPAEAATTLDNLQAAFNGESNAHARYLAFAERADQEGYAGVASLFRAAARAEEVHASNHAVVIRKLGAEPRATIDPVDVKATAENLRRAIEGESYERDTMYPEFITKARADNDKDAIRTFQYARTAEAEHAKLYTMASNDPDRLKAKTTFYVCQVCGYTTDNLDFAKCVSCFNPKEKYEAVG
jgi:rubrerythrin